MRIAAIAAAVAVAVSASGLTALTTDSGGASLYAGLPTRSHVVLGPVAVLARPGPDEPALPLADAARGRYGAIDAIGWVRSAPLPSADSALLTGVAIRWN